MFVASGRYLFATLAVSPLAWHYRFHLCPYHCCNVFELQVAVEPVVPLALVVIIVPVHAANLISLSELKLRLSHRGCTVVVV